MGKAGQSKLVLWDGKYVGKNVDVDHHKHSCHV